MRACDVPLTAVSTPSGMLWEWLVMPQGLSNAPATFNRLVTQLFRSHRAYAQTYFDDIFVQSRAEYGKSDVENHVEHLRAVLECMRTNKYYGNLDKRVFGAEEIPFLGCFIGKRGLRARSCRGQDHCGVAGSQEPKGFTQVASLSQLRAQVQRELRGHGSAIVESP
ncbi:hypothetical protein PC129_g24847 [Phytophthora cactorum]|uniref:Reverse transcriptase domain-containing protein n=1 Tax=Phytophthora cactorum TaxID=29920 RepID=A0A8T0ZJ67_9STRA|nr:hypothetical protein Pcac1_g16989 [Phytophthora cactorum]KAG2835717.1 hypothetical protein PC112_g5582 [Phytophthora cactorum]KAG2838830.1 hypothetical protein PC111_g4079 [Phytophthora cactorum]KAG2862755.1 hypothetical protein PC113_g6017 [Phytophthora cactorum]KAG2920139.1 hypothetical protein PC114_g6214 [Phytophthora cactorum]